MTYLSLQNELQIIAFVTNVNALSRCSSRVTDIFQTEVLVQVLEPGIDFEIKSLGGSDAEEGDECMFVSRRIVIDEIGQSNLENESEQVCEGPAATADLEIPKELQQDFSEHTFRWQSIAGPSISPATTETVFCLPSTNADEMTSLMYFQKFWKPNLTEHIAQQTNLYGMQKDCYDVATSQDEIEQFLRMQILVVRLPVYDMY